MPTVAIVGAGRAGVSAALSLRKAGFSGQVHLFSEEASFPYYRPALSKEMLASADDAPPLVPQQVFTGETIHYHAGVRVTEIDLTRRRLSLSHDAPFPFDLLIIATGGRARRLNVPGADQAIYVRTISDAHVLRRRLKDAASVVCIGGGIVGLEIASGARLQGKEVTVIEADTGLMRRAACPELESFITDLHRTNGIELRFGAQVTEISRLQNGRRGVWCSDGSYVETDCVVAGIGMVRNVELAADAGLAVRGGILVDAFGQARDEETEMPLPGVYAAGEVAAHWSPLFARYLTLEAWRHADDHGASVGRNIAGDSAPYDGVPWFWTDQFGANVQVAGLPSEGCRTVRRPGPNNGFALYHLDARSIVVGATTVNNGRESAVGQRLIRSKRPVDPLALGDPNNSLKTILAAAEAR